MTQAEPVLLQYRPPYDWTRMLRFLGARSVKGVEAVQGDSYIRTVRLGDYAGWVRVRNEPAQDSLLVEASPSLAPVFSDLLIRLQQLFDVNAKPEVVAAHLGQTPTSGTGCRAPVGHSCLRSACG